MRSKLLRVLFQVPVTLCVSQVALASYLSRKEDEEVRSRLSTLLGLLGECSQSQLEELLTPHVVEKLGLLALASPFLRGPADAALAG